MTKHFLLAICASSLLLAATQVKAQDIYGLVIGIDKYDELKSLQGAVNDAKSTSKLLSDMGAKRVIELTNEQAHRVAIENAWRSITSTAKKGDTVVLAYAGHGTQEPEARKGSEPEDGLDEVTVLGGFQSKAGYTDQRIRDKTWRVMVESVPHLNVVQLFDSCNSGSASRSLAKPEFTGQSRTDSYDELDAEIDMLELPPIPKSTEGALPNEVYIGATQDGSLVYELAIGDTVRGAASIAFDQAIRGKADVNTDGTITRGELAAYMRKTVRSMTESRQIPVIDFIGDPNQPLFASLPDNPLTGVQAISVHIKNASSSKVRELMASLDYASYVNNPSNAEIVWDYAEGKAYRQGDHVANPRNTSAMQNEIRRWLAVKMLREQLFQTDFEIDLLSGVDVHVEGQRVKVVLGERQLPYLTIVNIGPEGYVNYLFPVAGDSFGLCREADDNLGTAPLTRTLCEFEVVGPTYGAENLLVITSNKRLDNLHMALQAMDGRSAPIIAASTIISALANEENQTDIVSIFTARESPARTCGVMRCPKLTHH